jgi:hypothetical protein
MRRRVLLALVFLAAIFAGAGCDGDESPGLGDTFLTRANPGNGEMTAIIAGTLQLGDNGCILLSGEPVVWPAETTLASDPPELRLPGGLTARSGDSIQGGGGEVPASGIRDTKLDIDGDLTKALDCAPATSPVVVFTARGEAMTVSHASTNVFTRLRARPLRLPTMPRDTCRMSPELTPATANLPGRPGEAALGDGPVYVAFRGIPRLLDAFRPQTRGLAPSRWRVGQTVWIGAPAYRGPVLVRGARVDGPERLGFGATAVPSWRLRLPRGRWDERSPTFGRWQGAARAGWRFALAQMRVRAHGCYAVQIDGLSFSDVIVFSATLQP